MDSTKKNIQKTSGTRKQWKFYKPGQLVTIDRQLLFQVSKITECKR